MDERASAEQEAAILSVFTGKQGGPVADLAQLVGEVVGLERVPITFEVEAGSGRLRMGEKVQADIEAYRGGPENRPTTLSDTVFSTIPGSPAYVGRAPMFTARASELGIDLDLSGYNSVQGSFRFEA
jgi:hypothetical protein